MQNNELSVDLPKEDKMSAKILKLYKLSLDFGEGNSFNK